MCKKIHRTISLTIIIAFLFTLFIFEGAVQASGNTFYVDATNGDDNRTAAQAMSISTPWMTIQKAASYVSAGDTVLIRAGTYRETITPANSGSSGNEITYKPYNNETVTISGANEVGTNGWTVHSGNVYKKTFDLSLESDNQLFLNSNQVELARWPNKSTTSFEPFDMSWAQADSSTGNTLTDSGLSQADYWNGCYLTVHSRWDYSVLGTTVTEYSSSTNTLTFDSTNLPDWGVVGKNYYLSGKLELLDYGNEWCYSNGTIYMQTPAGDSPANYTVEAKARKYAVVLGTKQYINIEGLKTFAATIDVSQASHCVIDKVDAKYVSNYVFTHNGTGFNYDNTGIVMGGTENVLKNSCIEYSTGPLVMVNGSGNHVINNLLTKGAYGAGYNPSNSLIRLFGDNHLISHNKISSSGRACINGNFFNCRIQYNDLSDAMKNTLDGGVIYTGFNDFGNSEIHHNKIHSSNGVGIYLDNSSRNILVYKNSSSNQGGFNYAANFELVYNNSFSNSGVINGTGIDGNPQYKDTYGSQFINNISNGGNSLLGKVFMSDNINDGDPLFTNPGNNELYLQASSPARDSGMVINGITDGYVGSSPDMGAFEYGQTPWTAGYSSTSSPNPVFETTAVEYKNLLKNTGFEMKNVYMGDTSHDFDFWTKTGAGGAKINKEWAGVLSPEKDRSGEFGLELPNNANGNGIEQLITGLTPNTTYTVSGWVRASASGGIACLGAFNYGGNQVNVSQTGTTWEQKTVNFTTGPSNTSAVIYVWSDTGSTQPVYADDIGVVKTSPSYRLKSVYQNNAYLYEDNGLVKYGNVTDDRSKWVIEYVQGRSYQRFKNVATGSYINQENPDSYLQASMMPCGNWSTQWAKTPVLDNAFVFSNRYLQNRKLHIEGLSGYAECTTLPDGYWSSYWIPELVY